jgi:UDP-N-acetylmuramate dehydrogenase
MSAPDIRADFPLQSHNTLATPSTAEYFATLDDSELLPGLLAFARERSLAVHVLGEGSNVVLGEHLAGLWLRQAVTGREIVGEDSGRVLLRVAAGENWHTLVEWTLARGFFGLENLALIPGTVGAAPIQNIGAYGVEIGPRIDRLHCRDLVSGDALVLDPEACGFAYRDSVFKHGLRDKLIIESVELRLDLQPQVQAGYPSLAAELKARDVLDPGPADIFAAVVAVRRRRLPDPAELPNVGSFFKNPVVSGDVHTQLGERFPGLPGYPQPDGSVRIPAAWLIDQCGFRECSGNAVRVHPEHALVIINPERRPAPEVESLAADIREAVQERFDITLEQEPRSYTDGRL